uniref:Uncharacterized protein MANES_01G021700 n=1 Tax=Rhizophora mucronata TaxID=61149 RepID=A0A2P2P390_RHIMU
MANSMAALSRRLTRSLLSNARMGQISMPFCTSNVTEEDPASDESNSNSDVDPIPDLPSEQQHQQQPRRQVYDPPLENGLDAGIYRALLVGQVGQKPFQKKLKSGRVVTMLSVGTGGIRNNRRPFNDEEPKEYANRGSVQWHRVSVYLEGLGNIVMKNVVPGSIVYLEGNLETKVLGDPITGLVRRIREIAIRRDGRIIFLSHAAAGQEASPSELKNVGYY